MLISLTQKYNSLTFPWPISWAVAVLLMYIIYILNQNHVVTNIKQIMHTFLEIITSLHTYNKFGILYRHNLDIKIVK